MMAAVVQTDTMAHSAAVAECIEWLDRIVSEDKFLKYEKENALAFKNALQDGILNDHFGQYIFIQNGRIFQTSYTDADSFFHDANCKTDDELGLIYRVPDDKFMGEVFSSTHKSRNGSCDGLQIPVEFSVADVVHSTKHLFDTGASHTECPVETTLELVDMNT